MLKKIEILSGLILLAFISLVIYFFQDIGASDLEVSVQSARVSAVEARMINESMYQEPYSGVGIRDVSLSSLEGTEMSQSFSQDGNQDLLANEAIKDIFDYFLLTLGEYELEQVIASIQAKIRSELEEPARTQAIDLLKRYIDYKIGIDELQQGFYADDTNLTMIEKLVAQQAEIKAYRESFFSQSEYLAFFSDEERQNDFLIEQIKINQDDSLSLEEKERRLAQASMELPEDIRETRKRVQQHALLGEKVRALKANNAGENEIYALREQELGSEAAQALAELDQEREVWNQRLSSFAEERKAVLDSSLSEEDKSRSISQLLASQFTNTEKKRVNALVNDGRL